MEVRLQKMIAGTGLSSRRKAETLIASGRVTVNGKVVTELGTKVNPDRDHVKVDGKHLEGAQPFVYLILNKPKNVMSTLDDPEGRPTVKEYLHGVSVRVFPVGRLDFDSEGLMLLTNNGDLAQALLHPRYHVPKTYLIKVKGVLNDEEIGQLKRGRMGPLTLGDLGSGEFRFLTDREANGLRELVEQRLELELTGQDLSARPQRPKRGPGWAKPDRPRKQSPKKARVA